MNHLTKYALAALCALGPLPMVAQYGSNVKTGTGTGTVAAGDDTRIVNAVQPLTSLTGTYSTTSSNTFGNSFSALDMRVCGGQSSATCNSEYPFKAVQYKDNFTAAITGTAEDTTATNGPFQTVGVNGFAFSRHPGTTAVGLNGYAFSMVGGAKAFAQNLVWQDVAGLTSNVSGVDVEADWQPYNGPSAYTYSAIYHARLINNNSQDGVYPVDAFLISVGNNGTSHRAYFKSVFDVISESVAPGYPVFNINPLVATATASNNYSSPLLENDYMDYFDGTASRNVVFRRQANITSGTSPAYDEYLISHGCPTGGCPTGMAHYLDVDSTMQYASKHSDNNTVDALAFVPDSTANYTHNFIAATGYLPQFASLPSSTCPVQSDASGNLSCSPAAAGGSSSAPTGYAAFVASTTSGSSSTVLSNGYTYPAAPTCTATPKTTFAVANCSVTVSGSTATVVVKATGDDTFNVQVIPVTQ